MSNIGDLGVVDSGRAIHRFPIRRSRAYGGASKALFVREKLSGVSWQILVDDAMLVVLDTVLSTPLAPIGVDGAAVTISAQVRYIVYGIQERLTCRDNAPRSSV